MDAEYLNDVSAWMKSDRAIILHSDESWQEVLNLISWCALYFNRKITQSNLQSIYIANVGMICKWVTFLNGYVLQSGIEIYLQRGWQLLSILKSRVGLGYKWADMVLMTWCINKKNPVGNGACESCDSLSGIVYISDWRSAFLHRVVDSWMVRPSFGKWRRLDSRQFFLSQKMTYQWNILSACAVNCRFIVNFGTRVSWLLAGQETT